MWVGRVSGHALSNIALSMAALCCSEVANAAFVQIAEHSPAGLGNGFAGGAAIASDASTVWFNPAGMTILDDDQFIAGGYLVLTSSTYNDANSTTVLTTPMNGSNGGDPTENAFLPNLYYTKKLTNDTSIGIAVNVPFGVAGEYERDWVGRYHSIRSEIRTLNINPAIAYEFNDRLSVGGGISYQRMDSELSQAIDFGTLCVATQAPAVCTGLGLSSQNNDGLAVIKAKDDSLGYNLGMLWLLNNDTRFGLAYRSKVKYTLEGTNDITTYDAGAATLAVNPALNLVDSGARADVTMPELISLSVYHQINSQWSVMGDISRTRWSRISELRIVFDNGAADSVLSLDLQDVNRYSVGVMHTPDNHWCYRAGLVFDNTPTPNAAVRTPRIPDTDRTWVALGAGYESSERLSFDFAYAYLKFKDAFINKSMADTENTFRGNLVGNYKTSISIFSAQAQWHF